MKKFLTKPSKPCMQLRYSQTNLIPTRNASESNNLFKLDSSQINIPPCWHYSIQPSIHLDL